MSIKSRFRSFMQQVREERFGPLRDRMRAEGAAYYADFYKGLSDVGWFTKEPVKGFKGELFITLWDPKYTPRPEDDEVGTFDRVIPGVGILPVEAISYHHHNRNLIVKDASLLLARLAKDPSEPAAGINMLAVGTGAPGALLSPDAPTINQRKLNTEIQRKTFTSTVFRDSGGGASAIPTNVVDFTCTFSETEAVGPLNEMGLVSTFDPAPGVQNPNTDPLPPTGYDASIDVTSLDMLVNVFYFPVMSKPNTMKLTITWRISF